MSQGKHRYDRREQRHEDAVARQAARDARTDVQQMNRITQRPGVSAKETRRLIARQK